MIEDKLTHAERIRLEALAQAPHLWAMTSSNAERPELGEILALAVDVETWLQQADNDAPARFTDGKGDGQYADGELEQIRDGAPAPAAVDELDRLQLVHTELGTSVRTLHRGAVDGESGVDLEAIDYTEGTEVVVTLPRPSYAVARSRAATLLEAALSLVRVIGPGEVGHTDVVNPDLLDKLAHAIEELRP